MYTSFFNTQKTLYSFIRSSQELKLFCDNLKDVSFVTIDTEFKREKTFWPDLCLIQVANPRSVVLIDPLDQEVDLSPLYDILKDSNILKVVHAGYEDLEIFLHKTGNLPTPVFDTQIAAQFCGFGDSVGYHTLVKSICAIDLDKSQQRTDWTKRPLTASQAEYASFDVFYLRQIYDTLRSQLQKKGRLDWAYQEMKELFVSSSFQREGDEIWQRLKIQKKIDQPQQLCFIREIAYWREMTAQTLNLPRSWILSDSEIILFGKLQPTTLEDVIKIKPYSRYFKTQEAKSLRECLKKTFNIPKNLWPTLNPTLPLSFEEKVLLENLKNLLAQQAKHYGISASLIATRKDLEDFVRAKEPFATLPKIIKGWRQEIFGDLALKQKRFMKMLRNSPSINQERDQEPEAF